MIAAWLAAWLAVIEVKWTPGGRPGDTNDKLGSFSPYCYHRDRTASFVIYIRFLLMLRAPAIH